MILSFRFQGRIMLPFMVTVTKTRNIRHRKLQQTLNNQPAVVVTLTTEAAALIARGIQVTKQGSAQMSSR